MEEKGRLGNDIELTHGVEALRVYRAYPASGLGPGVIVLQETVGLEDPIRDACDRLARAGFVVLAIDFAQSRVSCATLAPSMPVTELPVAQIEVKLDFAIGALLGDAAVSGSKVGCVGLGAGGHLALLSAAWQPRIGAVVDCYGFQAGLTIAYEKIDAAVLGIFGEEDETISMEQLQVLRGGLSVLGDRGLIRVLPGVGHGFLNDADPEHFRAEAAGRIWVEIFNFLRVELR